MREICSKLALTPFSSVSVVDFEQVNVSWLWIIHAAARSESLAITVIVAVELYQ